MGEDVLKRSLLIDHSNLLEEEEAHKAANVAESEAPVLERAIVLPAVAKEGGWRRWRGAIENSQLGGRSSWELFFR